MLQTRHSKTSPSRGRQEGAAAKLGTAKPPPRGRQEGARRQEGTLTMKLFDKFKEKAWQAIKKKAVEVLVAMLTAAITALTTTSCMGFGPL